MNFLRTFLASVLGTLTALVLGGIILFMLIAGIASAVNSEGSSSALIQDNSIFSLKLDLPILDNVPGSQELKGFTFVVSTFKPDGHKPKPFAMP
jgi:hypothetical protein